LREIKKPKKIKIQRRKKIMRKEINLEAFKAQKEMELGKEVNVMLSGSMILYNTVDKTIVGYTDVNNLV
jgi:hypothetical protein